MVAPCGVTKGLYLHNYLEMLKKNNQNGRAFTNSYNGPSRYDTAEIIEFLQTIHQEMGSLKEIKKLLLQATAKQYVTIEQKQYLTVEDVTRIYDISSRTQCQERSAGRLKYRKKIEGQKILYEPGHLSEYISKYYQEQ